MGGGGGGTGSLPGGPVFKWTNRRRRGDVHSGLAQTVGGSAGRELRVFLWAA